jgi:hypothetical protein
LRASCRSRLSVPVSISRIASSERAYNDDGSLITDGLAAFPTSYLLRVPEAWNGRLLVIVPGGSAPHTQFRPFAVELLELGFAVVTINHPSPGFPGFPWESFTQRPHGIPLAYFSCIHFVKDFMAESFARAAVMLFFGESRGAGRGRGLLVGMQGNPIDGYVLFTGGAGRKDRLEATIAVLASAVNGTGANVIPLTGQPTGLAAPTRR